MNSSAPVCDHHQRRPDAGGRCRICGSSVGRWRSNRLSGSRLVMQSNGGIQRILRKRQSVRLFHDQIGPGCPAWIWRDAFRACAWKRGRYLFLIRHGRCPTARGRTGARRSSTPRAGVRDRRLRQPFARLELRGRAAGYPILTPAIDMIEGWHPAASRFRLGR